MDRETSEFLQQRALPPKPQFKQHEVQYHEKAVIFEEKTVGSRVMFSVSCPKCLRFVMLDTKEHEVSFDRTTGKVSVSPSLVCPHERCDLHVYVKAGVMTDC